MNYSQILLINENRPLGSSRNLTLDHSTTKRFPSSPKIIDEELDIVSKFAISGAIYCVAAKMVMETTKRLNKQSYQANCEFDLRHKEIRQ